MLVKRPDTQKAKAKTEALLQQGSWYYGWSDGWGASVSVREVDAKEARRVRNESKGFCGYEWMVTSILERGKILADHEIEQIETA